VVYIFGYKFRQVLQDTLFFKFVLYLDSLSPYDDLLECSLANSLQAELVLSKPGLGGGYLSLQLRNPGLGGGNLPSLRDWLITFDNGAKVDKWSSRPSTKGSLGLLLSVMNKE